MIISFLDVIRMLKLFICIRCHVHLIIIMYFNQELISYVYDSLNCI